MVDITTFGARKLALILLVCILGLITIQTVNAHVNAGQGYYTWYSLPENITGGNGWNTDYWVNGASVSNTTNEGVNYSCTNTAGETYTYYTYTANVSQLVIFYLNPYSEAWFGVNISINNGSSWQLPSEISGVSREDGATGGAMDMFESHGVADRARQRYYLNESVSGTIALRLTNINGTTWLDAAYSVPRTCIDGWSLFASDAAMWDVGEWGSDGTYHKTSMGTAVFRSNNTTLTNYVFAFLHGGTGMEMNVKVSQDNGSTWKWPSDVSGLSRGDGATGTAMNTYNTQNASWQSRRISYQFNKSQSNPPMFMFYHNSTTNSNIFVYGTDLLSNKTVFCFGDSITAGANATSAYPVYLGDLQPEYTIFNKGIASEQIVTHTSFSATNRWLFNCVDYDPSFIVLLEGVNDIMTGGKTDIQVEGYLQTLYTAAGWNSVPMIGVRLTPWESTNGYAYIPGINSWITNDATGLIGVVNTTDRFGDPTNYSLWVDGASDDNLHPNDLGYQWIAEEVSNMIDSFKAVANFTANVTSGTAPLVVLFNDSSTNVVSWAWDIDNDGDTDYTTQNCTHTYADVGTYSVKLTATNANGSDTLTRTDYIVASSPGTPPTAGFTASDTSVTVGTEITFSDISTGSTPLYYNWSWDDGTANSTNAAPTHTYTNAGTYTVILTVNNSAGENSTTMDITVSVLAPTAGFTASDNTVTVGTEITFDSGITTGSAPLYLNWSWGDGTANSTETSPTHTYGTAGTYTVILTANNSAGEDSAILEVTVSEAAAVTPSPYTPSQQATGEWVALVLVMVFIGAIAMFGLFVMKLVTDGDGDPSGIFPIMGLVIIVVIAIAICMKIVYTISNEGGL